MTTPDTEQVIHIYHMALDLVAKMQINLKPEEILRLHERLQADTDRSDPEDRRVLRCLVALARAMLLQLVDDGYCSVGRAAEILGCSRDDVQMEMWGELRQ